MTVDTGPAAPPLPAAPSPPAPSAPAPFVAVSSDAEPLVLRHIHGGVATLTLNNPRARNALSLAMIDALAGELAAVGEDESVRVVILAAKGPAFCAGHDLKELRAHSEREYLHLVFRRCASLMLSIIRLRQPVIARVHAIATAAGCQLVATCDLAVAVESARFATPGVNIGLFCSTPAVALSRAVSNKEAMAMLLTGDAIDAQHALRIGLINQVVPKEALDRAVDDLAGRIAAKSPAVVALGKQAFYRQLEMGVSAAYDRAAAVMTENMQLEDAASGIDAFLGKRPPVWRGC